MDVTLEELDQAYLNKWFAEMHDQIAKLGEPHCFAIFKTRAADGAVEGVPLKLYATRDKLSQNFSKVVRQLDTNLWRATTAAWWFDEE